jgi:hypothetical protein
VAKSPARRQASNFREGQGKAKSLIGFPTGRSKLFDSRRPRGIKLANVRRCRGSSALTWRDRGLPNDDLQV